VRALDEALLSARGTGSYLDRYVDLFRSRTLIRHGA